MSVSRSKLPSQTAALAGIPAGIQATGPWIGRRQLFVKFAEEAETATMYTADALRGELTRLAGRSRYHSIAVAGRDPLAARPPPDRSWRHPAAAARGPAR